MADFYFQTKNLSVGYDGKPLIRDISIGIEKGEIITLIGPNGSGKSTVLKSVARQLKPIAGTVTIEKTDLKSLSHRAVAKKMAVVLTERLHTELMTCWDVVALGRHPYTGRLGILSEADSAKVAAAMEMVHAAELAQSDFAKISDGQRQRILLARAICQEPEIVILDEPTSFLDVRHKVELLSILRSLAKKSGITVIMSLHEIDLAQKISDKLLCVKGETIGHYGTPAEVFREANIRSLYDIQQGFFDPMFGSIELAKPEGEAKVLVLSACGTGIPIYRELQKENTPFCAGILYTNDVDYRVARLLAAEVIEEKPFCAICDASFDRAVHWIRRAERIIDAGVAIGEGNRRMGELLRLAKRSGKLQRGWRV
ncbi:MAG: ABC transporter ATP-binding protein [Christensenellales bacterium]|jgi:iron complex transport system ATP-binding protein